MRLHPKSQVKRAIRVGRRIEHKFEEYFSVKKNFNFNIDSPRKKFVETKVVAIEGWIIPKDGTPYKLRVKNNQKVHEVKTGLRRLDVAKAHPEIDKKLALQSGFSCEIQFEDGVLIVEVDTGKGFKKLYSTQIVYSTGDLPRDIYNKDLSNNYPEHINLLNNRQQFYYEEAIDQTYNRHEMDPRLMAIYLPQFHPFPENDKAWGKGFTEWSNVTTGVPRFIGHQQPVLPKDLGFYDLRLDSKIKEQIDLAKKFGIYGFAFYYYWFSGKKVIEKPLEAFLSHKEWDFNFSICWANENWTKRWDGRDNDVIIAQEYLDEDPLNFIKDVEDILLDERYVTEAGKPILTVYRASELKNPKKYTEIWREYFRTKHGRELHLVSCLSFDDQDPREFGFDAALDFAPLSAFFKNELFPKNHFPYIDVNQKLLDTNFSGVVADYRSIALNNKLDSAFTFPTYPCITPSWDNDARKKGKGFIYQNSNPDLYAEWLERVVSAEQHRKEAPIVYINAWNEWAEGAIMEPSTHLGHAVLNRTVEVLSAHSKNSDNAKNIPKYGLRRSKDKKLAVVVHLYYPDLWGKIASRLNLIDIPFDLFVTLDRKDKDFKPSLKNKKVKVTTYIVPNRGRDVLPFIYVARRLKIAGYEYVLKLHGKKSKHRTDGSDWFEDMLEELLPDSDTIRSIVDMLAKDTTGIIGPGNHLVSLKRHMGSNKPLIEDILTRSYDAKTAKRVINQPEMYPYFGGTMLWLKLEVLDNLLELGLMPDDFQSEHGQIDGTIAHAIERLIGVIPRLNGKKIYTVSSAKVNEVAFKEYTDKYKYAP